MSGMAGTVVAAIERPQSGGQFREVNYRSWPGPTILPPPVLLAAKEEPDRPGERQVLLRIVRRLPQCAALAGSEGIWRVGVGQSSREETAKVYGDGQRER
jgi:hypothetical protein